MLSHSRRFFCVASSAASSSSASFSQNAVKMQKQQQEREQQQEQRQKQEAAEKIKRRTAKVEDPSSFKAEAKGPKLSLGEAMVTKPMTVLEMGTSASYKEDQSFLVHELRRNHVKQVIIYAVSIGSILLCAAYIPPYVKRFNSLVSDRKRVGALRGPMPKPENWEQLVEEKGERVAREECWKQWLRLVKVEEQGDPKVKSMFTSKDTALTTGRLK